MKYINYVFLFVSTVFLTGCNSSKNNNTLPYQPNILWIVVEDMSEHWSCYGETTIQTPNIDKLAGEGELFENAFVTSPVCSPSRSAMITGMHPPTFGAHNHRSQRIEGKGGGNTEYYDSYRLAEEVPFLPELFKEAGYYNVLGTGESMLNDDIQTDKLGKTDYNFVYDPSFYDSNDWKQRKSGQPFFAQLQLRGGKYRNAPVDHPVNPEDVTLPPYYPDDEIMREDWAEYLNSIIYLDGQIKKVMKRLEKEGIADSTAVFLWTDHGISHLRSKQYLYDDGIKVPLIVKWPEITRAGERRKDMVTQIDISATSLYLAGIPVPEVMQGKPFYGKNYQPADYIFAARDRCDETVDLIRAVRSRNFKYIRNFIPHKPHAQHNTYKDGKIIIRHMRELYAEDKLKEETQRYFDPSRPIEELYDINIDPYEMNNLASDPAYQDTLKKMQNILNNTIYKTKDLGFIPEPVLENLGKKYGNKYYILQDEENMALLEECFKTIQYDEDVEALKKAMEHESPAVRFWAAYGMGNILEWNEDIAAMLQTALNDNSDAVKIAAARALCKHKQSDEALNILEKNLENENLVITMYAAMFIEDLDENMISKVMSAIEKARNSPYEFTSRIAERLSDN